MELEGGETGNRDAGGLYGEDFRDPIIPIAPVKFLSDLRQKLHIQLMIQKAVDLQDLPRAHLPVPSNAFFQ